MKFCKDCAHYLEPKGLLAAVPGAPFCKAEATRYAVDVVTGNRRMRGCRAVRAEGEACGPSAVLFVEKQAPVPKKRWWQQIMGYQPIRSGDGPVQPPPRNP